MTAAPTPSAQFVQGGSSAVGSLLGLLTAMRDSVSASLLVCRRQLEEEQRLDSDLR